MHYANLGKDGLIFVDQKKEETKHRTEWCAEAEKYRCMRCGKSSKYTKVPGKCTGPKYLSFFETGKDDIWEVMTQSEEWTGRESS